MQYQLSGNCKFIVATPLGLAMPASKMIVWAPLPRKSYFALVSWKQVTNLIAAFWWCFILPCFTLFNARRFSILSLQPFGGSMIHNLAPSIAAFTCRKRDTPLLPLLNRQGWHGDINPPTDLQGAQTPRLFVCPGGPKRKEQIRTRVERFNMRHIKHDIFPNKKNIPFEEVLTDVWGELLFFLEDL